MILMPLACARFSNAKGPKSTICLVSIKRSTLVISTLQPRSGSAAPLKGLSLSCNQISAIAAPDASYVRSHLTFLTVTVSVISDAEASMRHCTRFNVWGKGTSFDPKRCHEALDFDIGVFAAPFDRNLRFVTQQKVLVDPQSPAAGRWRGLNEPAAQIRRAIVPPKPSNLRGHEP
jgi:hypothetical protein